MAYAFYLDPAQQDSLDLHGLTEPPTLAYIRLTDMAQDKLHDFNITQYPQADYIIAEIHPAQWDHLNFYVDRLSIVLGKSDFTNMTSVKSKMAQIECDVTFTWDHRFHVSYYFKMLQYWIFCGAKHVSFYDLTDFAKWQRVQAFLKDQGFYFYDRYHACIPGHESRYQKHLARFADLISIGGWSRVTRDGWTRTRAPKQLEWVTMSSEDARVEQLLFAFADRDGVALADLHGANPARAVESGMAVIEKDRLVPTDAGLWDTVGLVSHLQTL